MKTSWKDLEPAPIEFLHAELLNEFYKWRINTKGKIDGLAFNKIVANAKTTTYEKYKKLNLEKPISKNDL